MIFQIGYITQAGIFLLIVGIYCLIQPYSIAKWHANDEKTRVRMHKREQSHKKKSERRPYYFDPNREKVEPKSGAVMAVRILGGIAAVLGMGLILWAFLNPMTM